ncbi:microtubule-associated protein 4-like [Crotalus adamanteus]|uniref:Microtubule-associated protein 4-like n=1 Tax=Crotalus adamanteus TaxID=8729 RepID=A0AAW1B1J7_CROAD
MHTTGDPCRVDPLRPSYEEFVALSGFLDSSANVGKGTGGMADMEQNLSLADALTEPPPQIEEEVKRDFIASLEAEKFDDVIGEKVGKTDYVPLLDDEDGDGGGPKAENQETKAKPRAENLPRERECYRADGSWVGHKAGQG